MNWNQFCFYALMCFTSPLSHLNTEKGLCSSFKSEDVDKRSLVLDLSKYKEESEKLWNCMANGPFYTILIYLPEEMSGYHAIHFAIKTIQYDHLIVLNEAMPINLGPNFGRGNWVATSLTIYQNSNLIKWSWLKNTKFKYIRIESCTIYADEGERLDELILSDRLLTLTFVKNKNLNPLTGFAYDLAPNLQELSINHYEIYFLASSSKLRSKSLRRLNLSNNKIWMVEKDFFELIPKLEVLNLEGNNLKKILPESFPQLRKLLIDNNPVKGDAKTCKFLLSSSFVDYQMTDQICPDEKV